MIKLAIRLFFLWRRNHAPSIVFKTVVFAALGWLVFIPFAEPRTAGVAACAGALLALAKYGLQARRENACLLQYVGGDRQKLAALKQKFAKDAAAGGLMMEMVRAEMEESDYEDDGAELTEEDLQANREQSEGLLADIVAVLDETGFEIPERDARLAEVRESFEDGDHIPDRRTVLGTLLEHCSINFGFDDFCNDGDHAGLVEELAQATHGAWTPANVESTFDEESDRWAVTFQDNGKSVTWRFSQSGDHLSDNFVNQLFEHAQNQSGMQIVTVDSEDWFEGLILPGDLARRLMQDDVG